MYFLSSTLLLVGVIGRATYASRFYQPSLEPTVAMALWSKVAGRALPGLMMIAAITMFGAVRFGVSGINDFRLDTRISDGSLCAHGSDV